VSATTAAAGLTATGIVYVRLLKLHDKEFPTRSFSIFGAFAANESNGLLVPVLLEVECDAARNGENEFGELEVTVAEVHLQDSLRSVFDGLPSVLLFEPLPPFGCSNERRRRSLRTVEQRRDVFFEWLHGVERR